MGVVCGVKEKEITGSSEYNNAFWPITGVLDGKNLNLRTVYILSKFNYKTNCFEII